MRRIAAGRRTAGTGRSRAGARRPPALLVLAATAVALLTLVPLGFVVVYAVSIGLGRGVRGWSSGRASASCCATPSG